MFDGIKVPFDTIFLCFIYQRIKTLQISYDNTNSILNQQIVSMCLLWLKTVIKINCYDQMA